MHLAAVAQRRGCRHRGVHARCLRARLRCRCLYAGPDDNLRDRAGNHPAVPAAGLPCRVLAHAPAEAAPATACVVRAVSLLDQRTGQELRLAGAARPNGRRRDLPEIPRHGATARTAVQPRRRGVRHDAHHAAAGDHHDAAGDEPDRPATAAGGRDDGRIARAGVLARVLSILGAGRGGGRPAGLHRFARILHHAGPARRAARDDARANRHPADPWPAELAVCRRACHHAGGLGADYLHGLRPAVRPVVDVGRVSRTRQQRSVVPSPCAGPARARGDAVRCRGRRRSLVDARAPVRLAAAALCRDTDRRAAAADHCVRADGVHQLELPVIPATRLQPALVRRVLSVRRSGSRRPFVRSA